MSYTKGKWKAVCRDAGNPNNDPDWDEDHFLQFEVEGPRIPPGRGDYFAADAYLIAAAPDLLGACREALRLIRNQTGNWQLGTEDMLERAIAKAEGRT